MTERDAWPVEERVLPAELVAAAAANPGGAVAELDASLVVDPDGYVPVEAIVGLFDVGPDGVATGTFQRNPRHGAVVDDWGRLDAVDAWLDWLPGSPSVAVRASLEDLLTKQVAGAAVAWCKVTADPAHATLGYRDPTDPDHVVVAATGLATPFALEVRSPDGRREVLMGVHTWVCGGLDEEGGRTDGVGLDLGAAPDAAQALLERHLAGA